MINKLLRSGCCECWGHSDNMIMSLLDVGYLDPWGSLSFGLGFLIGWGHCFETELHWEKANEAESLLLNISTGLSWVMTQNCSIHRIHIKSLCLFFVSTVKHFVHHNAERSDVSDLWPPCPHDPGHTIPPQWLSGPLSTLIYPYLRGSMSFASDTWGFRHMRLFVCAWLPNLRLLWWVSTEEARGRSRGRSAWCLWSAMGNRRGYDALVTRECGDRTGQRGSPHPLVDTLKLSWVWKEKIGNLRTGKCAFQSNSISLSLLPLPSLSSPGTAGDVSVLVLTCGELCHVNFLWRLCKCTHSFEYHTVYSNVFIK